jgi:23S rRNA (guanine745-N1)-methyltransferase
LNFICPKCKGALTVTDVGTAKCPLGHSYDRAKEGYYNLLLSSVGGTHGDNREMVMARRAFLDTGAYMPLARRVAELAAEHTPDGGLLLDCGCGEGFYTHTINEIAKNTNKTLHIHGFDISKAAVRLAAKRDRDLSLAVASSYDLPIADGTFDTATNVFSPLALEETLRVLRAGGVFIMAIPAERHLFGLKSVLYDTPYLNEVASDELAGLELVSREKIAYELNLDTPEKIRSLFMMTPYAYRTPASGRARLEALTALTTEIEFYLFTYKKIN